ncbi:MULTISPECIES: hypothetical protein [Peribacillus]|uniref:hypothetical protein n=1 Tax=Peribacillus TaxID=2675229 RepID=UPI001F4DEECD|nr:MULTISPECIES: hypothetical protein [unclassified Peribacillus]MCK1982232.1 hypothetical protein [Peribacillus sp. Aquil_B1]MCK2007416.1 hypothetical protein [Peribacillus sp. Aquil_B8]
MTTINLKIKNEEGGKKVIQHEIEELNGFQFEGVMKVVNNIIKELRDDESLQGLFSTIFGDADLWDVDIQDIDLAQVNSQFITNGVNSFETILIKLPNRAFELLSVLSGVEVNVIKEQKFDDILNIYDAILEENDVDKLIKRVKKSFVLTQGKMKFLNLVKKVTGTPETPTPVQ